MTKMFLGAIMLFIACQLVSAKAPIKFGKVNIEDLKMTVYEPDTSASAVVLCKYGYFNANSYAFTTITRVKILKKSGVSLSEFTFPGKEDMQVRGRVFNLENGEIVDERLKGESIYKVKITDDNYMVRVALPNVKVGSVYDIETSQKFLPSEFSFQREIPIKYCELVLEQSSEINYRKRPRGFELIQAGKSGQFYVKNMPAFKSEPYMDSSENYLTKFEFDILNIHVPGFYREYTTSWEAVNKRLRSREYFAGALLNGVGGLNSIKKEIEEKYSDPYDKMVAAYEAIKKVKWNERATLYASATHLGGIFKEKKGNSAEINMLLYQLLNKLDVHSLPVAISTRKNGQLHRFYPSLEKLNYMFICSRIGDKEYLLDATEELMPADMLPMRCLNKSGRLINNESGKWINLKTDKKDKSSVVYTLKLNEDFEAEGSMECSRYDYSAYYFRKEYKNFASDEDFLNELEADHQGLRIKSFSFTDLDSIYKPINEKYEIKVNNIAQKVGDMVMINPFIFEKVDDNPFKLEERNYPVDFAYNREKLVMSTITIPDGYVFNTIPKPARIALPEKSGSVLISYNVTGNNLNMVYKIKINKPVFSPTEYPYLKQLYALIIEKHAEPVVIKKNQDEASL